MPDEDLGEDFGIFVPTSTALCTLGTTHSGVEGILEERRHATRIYMKTGLVRLPRSGQIPDLDWIDTIEVGPDRLVPTRTGPGYFVRDFQNGMNLFNYRQEFSLDGTVLQIAILTAFEAADDPLRVLDAATLDRDPFGRDSYLRISGTWSETPSDWHQVFTTCEFDRFDPVEVDVEIQGGHGLNLSYRCPPQSDILILTTKCSCAMNRARFTTGDPERVVEDFFDMVHVSWNHCDMDQTSLVMFDSILGQVQGLVLMGGAHSTTEHKTPTEIQYLGSDLSVVDTRAITSWNIQRGS